MSYTKIQGKTLQLNDKHHSDGSELIPAEVQANIRYDEMPHEEVQLTTAPYAIGYTIDDEGQIDSYSIEPVIYPSDYPSPRQQRQYIALGAAATLLIVLLIMTAFLVSY